MRYAICFTPSASDPLTLVAANWLGRNVYSGEMVDPPAIRGLGIHEIAFYTAVPRRYGFMGLLKAPFRLADDMSEAALLRELMRFSGTVAPFEIPKLEVARLGGALGLVPSAPSQQMNFLAASLVQAFDHYRAPLTEAEFERIDPDGLSATQFAKLHRWCHPHVMDEFRLEMMVPGTVSASVIKRIERVLRDFFEPALAAPLPVSNIALMMEDGSGGPFRVHSLHPMGKVSARKIA